MFPWAHRQGDLKLPMELQRVMVQRLRYCHARYRLLVYASARLSIQSSARFRVPVCLSLCLSVFVTECLSNSLYLLSFTGMSRQGFCSKCMLFCCMKRGRGEGYVVSQL